MQLEHLLPVLRLRVASIVLLALVVFVPLQISANNFDDRYNAQMAEYRARVRYRHDADVAAQNGIRSKLHRLEYLRIPRPDGKHIDLSFDSLREILSATGTLEMLPDGRAHFVDGPLRADLARVMWDERFYHGGEAWLLFADGKCTGVDNAFRAPPDPPGAPARFCGVVTTSRRVGYVLGYVAAALLLVVWTASWRRLTYPRRLATSFAILVIAALSSALSFLGPNCLNAWRSFFSPDAGGWSLILVPAAILTVVLSYLRRPARQASANTAATTSPATPPADAPSTACPSSHL